MEIRGESCLITSRLWLNLNYFECFFKHHVAPIFLGKL
jgi:hypothetical protein